MAKTWRDLKTALEAFTEDQLDNIAYGLIPDEHGDSVYDPIEIYLDPIPEDEKEEWARPEIYMIFTDEYDLRKV